MAIRRLRRCLLSLLLGAALGAVPAAASLCASCPCLSSTRMATDGDGTYSCADRVAWLMASQGKDQASACLVVNSEFPSICTYTASLCETSNNCGAGSTYTALGVSGSCPKLTWSDEFSGSSLNTSKWSHQLGDGCDLGLCGWGNNELEYYQAANAKVSSGRLIIEARKESVGGKSYTSARIRTKGLADFQYGRLEALIKIPKGQGLWPAFWMLPTDEVYGGWPKSGEIDILEAIGRDPSRAYGTLHYGQPWPNNLNQGSSIDLLNNEYVADQYHEFAIDWSPGRIAWSLDGGSFLELTNTTVSPWPFNQRFHFVLNVAVGGNWPGNPDGTTSFPQQMLVDYVRAYDTSFGRLDGPMYVTSGARRLKFNVVSGVSDYKFTWSVPSGAKIASTSTNGIVVTWGSQSGYVKVTATSSKCGITKTFSLPVKVVQTRTTSTITNCGCTQCTTAILERMAGDFSCIARMEWMVQSAGMAQQQACTFVSKEYPGVCGTHCDPSKCKSSVTAKVALASLDAVPAGRCARRIIEACGCERLGKKRSCWSTVVVDDCGGSSLSRTDRKDMARKAILRAKDVCLRKKLTSS